MDVIYQRCAGLDVHKKSVMACVRVLGKDGRSKKFIREFGTMTDDLEKLRKWLTTQKVTHVAMESTGVYWKPVWNVLEEGNFELLLCNARDIKQVPGRKTDVKDSEWIARLLQHGLLRGSFVPSKGLRNLRDLTRTRAKLTDEKTRHVNRLQKILEDTNVKLSSVATDTLGVSGRAMLEAILRGEDDPEKLAKLARGRLRSKIPQLRLALKGNVTEHHRYMLQLHYGQILHLEAVISDMDARIRRLMGNPEDDPESPSGGDASESPSGGDAPEATEPAGRAPLPPLRNGEPPGGDAPEATEPAGPGDSSSDSAPAPSTSSLCVAVVLLCTIPGISTRTAENILAETGDDMSRFPTAGNLTSWAGVAPGNNESAGKRRSGKTTGGNRFLRRALSQAAWAASRTKGTYYSALYRRLVGKRGKKRAIIAVARSMLVTIYHMLDRGTSYEELGDDYFDTLNSKGITRYHVGRLEKLGYSVKLEKDDTDAEAA